MDTNRMGREGTVRMPGSTAPVAPPDASASLVIRNAGQLLTLAGPAPRVGASLRELGIIEQGAVAIAGERIAAVGSWEEVAPWVGAETEILDAGGRVVMPGFVDCHTHAVFAGSRERDFVQKIEGRAYLEILAAGGGILNTVRATRAASEDELLRLSQDYLFRMFA